MKELMQVVGAYWYLNREEGKSGKVYIYLVKKICEDGRCRREWNGSVDEITRIMG